MDAGHGSDSMICWDRNADCWGKIVATSTNLQVENAGPSLGERIWALDIFVASDLVETCDADEIVRR